MAYDETTAQRIRDAIGDQAGIAEKKMFGGVAFLLHGNMAVGVRDSDMMVRCGKEGWEALLERPHVDTFGPAGRVMKGWVKVSSDGLADDEALEAWVERGLSFASTLDPK